MPLDTYEELLESVCDELGRDDLKAKSQEWVWLAELAIQRELEFAPTEKVLTAQALSADASTIAAPSDFLAAKHIEIQYSPKKVIYPTSFDTLTRWKNNSTIAGEPTMFTVHNGTIYLAPATNTDTTYDLYYWGGMTHLSETNTTNELLTFGAACLKYGALGYSAPYVGDDQRIQVWSALSNAALESLQRTFWNAKVSGGPLHTRPDSRTWGWTGKGW